MLILFQKFVADWWKIATYHFSLTFLFTTFAALGLKNSFALVAIYSFKTSILEIFFLPSKIFFAVYSLLTLLSKSY